MTEGEESFRVMHICLGLGHMKRAVRDVCGADATEQLLEEVYGASDATLSMFLGTMCDEIGAWDTLTTSMDHD